MDRHSEMRPRTAERGRRSPRRRCAWGWKLAGITVLLLTVLPQVMGETLMELEQIVAQPLLRLVLLAVAAVLAVATLRRATLGCAALPLLTVVILLVETGQLLGVSLVTSPVPENALRVFTQNVAMESPAALGEWIAAEQPDLVLLQEVYNPYLPQWEALATRLGYHSLGRELRRDAGMGGLMLSKWPLMPLSPVHGPTSGGRSRYFLRADIDFDGLQIQVLAVHLESLPIVGGQRRLFGSSIFRYHQAKLLAFALPPRPTPVILGGDLNATPLYASTRPLRRALQDTWPEGGLGWGFTYPATLPLTRIDAIMQRGFRTLSCRVVRVGDSDHRGLYAVLVPDGQESGDHPDERE